MNVALAEVRSRRLTGAFARRVPGWEGWKSVQPGLFPVPTLYEHIIKHRLCLSSKLKKKQSFKALPGHESASEKYRKQRFLHDRTAGMPRTSCPDRNTSTVRIGYRVTGYNDLPGIMIELTKIKIKASERHTKYHYIQCISAVVIYRM